ncbi:MAG: hypothetical protein KAX11_03700 [Candidatus Aminicenantes bacterium]|nr:hypothetical protein [Candidatus Aminicenantes bacterium]
MKWIEFLKIFADQPLFHSSMMGIFPDSREYVQVQLSRWARIGKLNQIRRGWYLIEAPYCKKEVPSEVIANTVVSPSYLSLEWAMAFHGMIPEDVPNPTSITTTRAEDFQAIGRLFLFKHIKPAYFTGYVKTEYKDKSILVAFPEKALWDKVYFFTRRNRFSMRWLEQLRLQNLDEFNFSRWGTYVALTKYTALQKAFQAVEKYIKEIA